MGIKKKYWTGMDELDNTPAFRESISSEFKEGQSVENFLSDSRLKETSTARRDFLKFMGFSIGAATLAACETPVVKAVPYVTKPDEITPGVANFYASTYYDGNDYGNILVKAREGRPIFIKGNKDTGFGNGAVNSRINASVLGIYDSSRLKGPRKAGTDTDWATLDKEVKSALGAAANIRILSSTVISPSTQRAINEFSAKYAGKVKHVQYDAWSYNALRKANYGIPSYDFSKVKTVVSLACDFMGTWLTPHIFASQFAKTRKPELGEKMSRHIQFETIMSLTGSNADERYAIKPSQEGMVAAALWAEISGSSATGLDETLLAAVKKSAADLRKGNGLVVSASNDLNIQTIVSAINGALNTSGSGITDSGNGLHLFKGDDSEMKSLVSEMEAGSVDALIIYGVNPSYSWYEGDKFTAALGKVKTSVAFSLYADETAKGCTYIAPDHHYLESWNDYNAVGTRTDLAQPLINPLYNTRYAQESLLTWADNATPYYDYLRQTHNGAYTPLAMNTDAAWNMAVHNGTFNGPAPVIEAAPAAAAASDSVAVAPIVAAVSALVATPASAPADTMVTNVLPTVANPGLEAAVSAVSSQKGGDWEVVFYQKVTMGTGIHANNPVLQETPDPITKVTWDNYITMAPADVKEKGLHDHIAQVEAASLAKVVVNGKELVLPVFPTPGQKRGTIGIALGYGRGAGNEEIGKAAFQTGGNGEHLMEGDKRVPVGKNAYPMVSMVNGGPVYWGTATVEGIGEDYFLATTQMHNTVMGRDSVVKETTLTAYWSEKDKKKGQASFNPEHTLAVHHDVNGDDKINAQDQQSIKDFDLWKAHPIEGVGLRWGLTIDLTSCIGCGSCITACHTENNVPVVGKDEVLRHRDMHWMRIDRFFSSDFATLEETKKNKELGTIAAYGDMEHPEENPMTVHMPMMCQHCNHAPCETVCPVAATVHSNEGLNNMAYNRCIGTRYCANNCPYKVRRFNWFNYVTNDKFAMVNPAQDDTQRMVLNPDVTVRTRGVMEKCSMCQQRIQAGKVTAKKAGRKIMESDIVTACAEACPTNAIVFGDLNDTTTQNHARSNDVRTYHALEETGVQPNVFYMTKVRNTEA